MILIMIWLPPWLPERRWNLSIVFCVHESCSPVASIWLQSWWNILLRCWGYCLRYSSVCLLHNIYSSVNFCPYAESFSFLDGHLSTSESLHVRKIYCFGWKTSGLSNFTFFFAAWSRGSCSCPWLFYYTGPRSKSSSCGPISFIAKSFSCSFFITAFGAGGYCESYSASCSKSLLTQFIFGASCFYIRCSLSVKICIHGTSSYASPSYCLVRHSICTDSCVSVRILASAY